MRRRPKVERDAPRKVAAGRPGETGGDECGRAREIIAAVAADLISGCDGKRSGFRVVKLI